MQNGKRNASKRRGKKVISGQTILVHATGLACRGAAVFIIGGKAFTDRQGKQLLLADIFQFHPEECCWVQVHTPLHMPVPL